MIEYDDLSHNSVNPNNFKNHIRDILKDIYAYNNGLSLLRISEKQMHVENKHYQIYKTIDDFINQIIHHQKPIINFTDKIYYIRKQKILQCITYKANNETYQMKFISVSKKNKKKYNRYSELINYYNNNIIHDKMYRDKTDTLYKKVCKKIKRCFEDTKEDNKNDEFINAIISNKTYFEKKAINNKSISDSDEEKMMNL
jgi:hypothetical protein